MLERAREIMVVNLEEARKESRNRDNRRKSLSAQLGKNKPNLTNFLIRTSHK